MRPLFPAVLAALCLCGLSPLAAQDQAATFAARQKIEQTLAEQAAAWNRGDLEGFMAGYDKSQELRFASGGTVTYGWQQTLERYQQHYPNRAAMGVLTFSELKTDVLSADAALVFGRWRLKTDQGEPNGLFTLLLRQTSAGWRVVADHTSAAPAAGGS